MNEVQMHGIFNLVLLTSIITHIYLNGETIVKALTCNLNLEHYFYQFYSIAVLY